ncbi:hypothetical protein K8S19_13230 [bacterium]|nr:hypothetical protein [bacterium]
MKYIRGILFCCIGFLSLFQVAQGVAESTVLVEVGDKVPDFVIEGADDKSYELGQMKGKVIILVMGPKAKEENSENWVKMLLQTFPPNDSLEIFSVFDMQGIPFFITRNFVIGKIKEIHQKSPVTILMDWEQKVNKLLGADKDETDVLVIAADGVLVSHVAGPYSEDKFQLVRDKLEEILESDSVEEQKEGDKNDAGKTNPMGG